MLPGPAPHPRSGSLIPTAPADLVAALGKADQKLYISQELGLVVARLGEKADPESRPALSTFDAVCGRCSLGCAPARDRPTLQRAGRVADRFCPGDVMVDE